MAPDLHTGQIQRLVWLDEGAKESIMQCCLREVLDVPPAEMLQPNPGSQTRVLSASASAAHNNNNAGTAHTCTRSRALELTYMCK
jgi:hypothetical protein